MSIRRASLILPCQGLDDFPSHLSGKCAAELLAAWTVLWHPALLSATGRLPGWHPAENPPEPDALDGELILIPPHSADRLPSNWQDRFRDTAPRNPPPVTASASRAETLNAALAAAGVAAQSIAAPLVGDFLALGYAYLQVELLTRAMHYATVLDSAHFTSSVVAAAGAALAGDEATAHGELARPFDLLMDARNHVYSVDFYVVDVTLLAPSTLGEALREKLAGGLPTNLLATGELIEQLAHREPQTLAELQRAVAAGTACVCGGLLHDGPIAGHPPEAILAELVAGRENSLRHLGRASAIFGQFDSGYSPLLPEILSNCGFHAALHASFDGGSFPRAEQRKTLWGPRGGPQIEALSARPLDVAQPETWLNLARQAADSIAHDHVATVLLAGWPGQASEYVEDLRRVGAYGPLLGKLVTLEDYFRNTRKVDDWLSFYPLEYPAAAGADLSVNPICSRVERYRRLTTHSFDRLEAGLARIVLPVEPPGQSSGSAANIVLNPWNFATVRFADFDPLGCELNGRDEETANLVLCGKAPDQSSKSDRSEERTSCACGQPAALPDVPGCGYTLVGAPGAYLPPVPLSAGRTIRNERLEVVISESSGGIQSLRGHRDRRTRVSQRLVMHDQSTSSRWRRANEDSPPRLETQMLADHIAITRNDAVAGEITSQGRLLDTKGALVARYKQMVRLPRWLPAVFVDVELQLERRPEAGARSQYIASRLAWSDDALGVRRGVDWVARPTRRQQIESPEWVEVSDGVGCITCFAFGLPFHRLVSATWLDTLFVTAREEGTRFQFAIGLDCENPAQMALALLTGGRRSVSKWPGSLTAPRGWFLHVGAKNVIATHLEPLPEERPGIRMRLLETEGRHVRSKLSAFRPFRAAQATDFLGQSTELLSVVDGQVQLEIGPHRWLQVEAEW